MSVIADIVIPADEFALGALLEVRPGVQVRLESMIPTGEAVVPYLWVRSPDADSVERALREAEGVEDVTVVDRTDDETLFRVDWVEDIDGFIGAIRATDAAVLAAQGHGDHWSFNLRFPEYGALSTFYRDAIDKGLDVRLEGVHDPTGSGSMEEFGLSAEQREALRVALDAGYFAVPRGVTMVELGEKLGISDSAASQRLRRGLSNVLSATITGESSDD